MPKVSTYPYSGYSESFCIINSWAVLEPSTKYVIKKSLGKQMTKIIKIELEWKYTPENYFEDPIDLKFDGGHIKIQNGIVNAIIDPVVYDSKASMTNDLNELIKSRFFAMQLLTHREFSISDAPARTDFREDGTKNYHIMIEPAVIKMSAEPIDIIVKDRYGNVISDSRKERKDLDEHFISLVGKYITKDTLLFKMILSYNKSVNDPENELIHLYEIRDALNEFFGSQTIAIAKLGISNNEWNELGKLANSIPVKQGRHRGKSLSELRNADNEELDRARKCGVKLISKYLMYLENNVT
jgi:hypothetical protein